VPQNDVIVVGARCAGASLAIHLARRGLRVVLVDKATFPSDTMSSLYIQPRGMACLQRLGLIEQLAARGTPEVHTNRQEFGNGVTIEGYPGAPNGVTYSMSPRRTVLDSLLVDEAARAGADVRTGVRVRDVVRDGDRVVGVRAETKAGAIEERARLVVGADGMRSPVAAAVGAETYDAHPSTTCVYYAFYSGAQPTDRLDLHVRDGFGIATGPTNGGLTLVAISWRRERFDEVRSDPARAFASAIASAPELHDRLASGTREERFIGTGDVPIFFRKPFGPGWALVGDAGYYRDPVTAQGIGDALWSAEHLARAVSEGLSGARPLDDCLADHHRERDALFRPCAQWTMRTAQLRMPNARSMVLFAAIGRQPSVAERFFGLFAGNVLADDFFSPESVQRILEG
jgi:flavin-dependent dehydrogenase